MAFKKIANSNNRALVLEKKGQSVEGYLIGCKTKIGKFKSTILTLKTETGPQDVWSNERFDAILIGANGKTLSGEYAGKLLRFTCVDVRTERKGKKVNVYRDIQLEVDDTKKVSK